MKDLLYTLLEEERPGYCLVHDVAFRAPWFGTLISRLGALRACSENAEKVFDRGGPLLVFPGGELDCYRSFGKRNIVDFFGRTGFVPFLPLPAKISYKLGKPFHFRPGARLHDDEDAVRRAYAAIGNSMQDMVDDLANRRRFPVLG